MFIILIRSLSPEPPGRGPQRRRQAAIRNVDRDSRSFVSRVKTRGVARILRRFGNGTADPRTGRAGV